MTAGRALAVGLVLLIAATTAPAGPTLQPRVVHTNFPTDDIAIASAIVVAETNADCTAAIQAAIDAVHADGGGVVFLPAGRYRCDGNLVLKQSVTLRGDWASPEQSPKVAGTILMPTAGRGKSDGAAFLTMQQGSSVRELSIWYPDQKMDAITPYPFTIQQAGGDNITVHHVTFVNSYQAVRCGPGGNELHTLRDVFGTPLKCGIWLHMCTDIGRLVNVHFAPRYWLDSGLGDVAEDALRKFLREQGTGLEIHRSDWEYIFGVHLEGYARGLHIRGSTNAALYDFDATGGTVGLQIDALLDAGLAVSNSRLDGSHAAIAGAGQFNSVAQFNNCTIGGVAPTAVRMDGTWKMSFQNCTFPHWTESAVHATHGSMNLFGCWFRQSGTYANLGGDVARALILGNHFEGEPSLVNASHGDVQIANYDFGFTRPSDERIVLPPDPRPATDKLFNVLAFGAKADATNDNTAAFQFALDAAAAAGGGTVFVPGGRYQLNGHLTVAYGVELRGCFDGPHHTISGGSTLLTTAGKGDERGQPFITLASKSGVRGLTIWYPEQDIRNITPYPWAIRSGGTGCWVLDVSVSNAYQGADFGSNPSDDHLIRYLGGAPLRRGLWVSKGSGVVDMCHFNPHFWGRRPGNFPEPSGQPVGEALVEATWKYQQQHLEAFIFGRCPGEVQVNNFVFAALHGLRFVDDEGGCAGRVINHGSDATSHGVTVDATDPRGIELINTELTSFGVSPVGDFVTTETFSGKVSLFNTLSWAGPVAPTAVLRGHGDVLLQQWNSIQGQIVIDSGRATLENFHFQNKLAPAVHIGKSAERVRLIGNTAPGGFTFTPGSNVVARASSLPTADAKEAVAPRAIPDGGAHAAPLTVTLAADGNNRVRYTLDGSLPDANAPQFKEPIVFAKPGLYEIRFVTVDADGKAASPVQSRSFEIR